MSNSRAMSAREALANAVVQPNANFQESAQSLAAAFLAGRKTPEEVQLEAAKNSLAQQSLLDEMHKNQDYVMRQQALDRVSATYDPSNPALYPADTVTGTSPNIHDVFSTPQGAAALRDNAIALIKSGVKPQDVNDINRTLSSYQANVPSTGMTDEMIQRLAGSPTIGVNDALSIGGQNAVAQRNAALDVYKTNATKGPKDLKTIVTNEVINRTLQGQPIDPNLRDAYRVANPLSGEAGPRASMAQSGIEQLTEAKKLLTNPVTGKFDNMRLAEASADIPGLGNGLPFSPGRQARNSLSNALEAQLRLETGAAVNAGELPRILDRLLPSLFDNEATKQQKLGNLDRLLAGTLEFIDPTNPYLARDKINGGVVDLSGGQTKSTPYGTTAPITKPAPVVNPAAQTTGDRVYPAEAAAALLPPEASPSAGEINFNDLRRRQ